MAKKNTCITLDTQDIDKIRDMGFSISKFTQKAIDTLLSEGFEDYVGSLKVKLISEDLQDAREEYKACEERLAFLHNQINILQEVYNNAEEELEIAMTVGKLSKLIAKINKYLVMESYDVDVVSSKYSDVINEIKRLNPEFDLSVHRDRIMKIMGY